MIIYIHMIAVIIILIHRFIYRNLYLLCYIFTCKTFLTNLITTDTY